MGASQSSPQNIVDSKQATIIHMNALDLNQRSSEVLVQRIVQPGSKQPEFVNFLLNAQPNTKPFVIKIDTNFDLTGITGSKVVITIGTGRYSVRYEFDENSKIVNFSKTIDDNGKPFNSVVSMSIEVSTKKQFIFPGVKITQIPVDNNQDTVSKFGSILNKDYFGSGSMFIILIIFLIVIGNIVYLKANKSKFGTRRLR